MTWNSPKLLGMMAILILLSAALYLGGLAWQGGDQGFPLDDAWIHQTYARHLARDGQWAYVPGRPSTGSTSPLWTLALALGYAVGLDCRVWTFALGVAALALVGWLGCRLAGRLFGTSSPVGWLVAAGCVLEWHLVWAAFSGMETLLFAALVLWCIERYAAFEASEGQEAASAAIEAPRDSVRGPLDRAALAQGLLAGLCGGLLVLTRPEGLILLALIAGGFLWGRWRGGVTRASLSWAVALAVGCLALVVPYAAFNLKMAGFIFPTTFYAKQAEYRVVIESLSLPARFVSLLVAVLAGPQILLIPGFLFGIGHSLRQRAPVIILLWLWWVCLVSIYALRLPVAYQHGRYLIPTVPVFILLGTWGTWQFLRRSAGRSVTRIAGRTWGAAIVVLFILFWLLGARAYISDVGFINGEMGEMAGWLAKGIPPEARLAVHDIGLVGYRLERPFIDLAGLITPEVIPFISDEKRLLAFMESQKTDYLVLFPDWSDAYHRMVQDPRLTLVHTTGYTWTLSLGRRNLSAYHVDWSR